MTPEYLKIPEAEPLVSIDSLDWDISEDFLTLTCQNSGVWHVISTYQLKSLDIVGIGKIEAYYNINDEDLMNTSNKAIILTPEIAVEDPTQRTILTTSIVKKFSKGHRLKFIVIGENNNTHDSNNVIVVVSSLLTSMMKR